jgi:8-oxo-dGTP pyrophosphatase MutT (NUDIX family)
MGSPARRTESPGSPATPVDAASVILLRDGGDNGDGGGGPQVYMLRRQRTMAFASGMYVFPGGRVDPRDAGPDVPWTGPGPGYFAAKLSTSEPLARALVCAAVRETFEESGVLLADRPGVQTGGFDTGDAEWEADRRALLDRTLAFSDLLVRRGLVLRSDLLRCWAHWITPDGAPLRYDTRFFVAAVPAGQRTRDVGGEYDEVTWVRPADAVEAWSEGAMPMLPPTLRTLAELASYGSVEEVLAAAEHRRIEPIQPKAVLDGEAVRFVLPGDPEYGA